MFRSSTVFTVLIGLLCNASWSGPDMCRSYPTIGCYDQALFSPLFNGRDLSGWWGLGTSNPAEWQLLPEEELAELRRDSLENIRQHWSVDGGELISDGSGLFLTSRKDFSDFELSLEFKLTRRADSGIYLRGIPQVQIWDYTYWPYAWFFEADKGSGGLWNNAGNSPGQDPQVPADMPIGDWNHMRILMIDELVTVWLNDTLVVDRARLENYFDSDVALPDSGPIQLQNHGGETRWRNVFIREVTTALE